MMRLLARTLLFASLVGVTLLGCELAVDPDVSLAVVPVQTCAVCLDAADTVITEPDGNVVIVPVTSIGDAGDAAADDDASETAAANAADM